MAAMTSLVRQFFVALVLILTPAVPAAAQRPVDLSTLDAAFTQALKDWAVPGMAVAVVKDGQVVFAKGYGVKELGRPDPVDDKTLFAIASNTKAFTSAAMAILVDERKLGWDDRVIAHLPYFQLYDPYVTNETRVRDLMSHRSGLGTFSGDLLWYGTSYSREEVVRRARFLKPVGPFRARYGYQNVMFVAAGEVVAKASGQRWEDFLGARIFRPLGMTDTDGSGSDALALRHVPRQVAEAVPMVGRRLGAVPHGQPRQGDGIEARRAERRLLVLGAGVQEEVGVDSCLVSSSSQSSRWRSSLRLFTPIDQPRSRPAPIV